MQRRPVLQVSLLRLNFMSRASICLQYVAKGIILKQHLDLLKKQVILRLIHLLGRFNRYLFLRVGCRTKVRALFGLALVQRWMTRCFRSEGRVGDTVNDSCPIVVKFASTSHRIDIHSDRVYFCTDVVQGPHYIFGLQWWPCDFSD